MYKFYSLMIASCLFMTSVLQAQMNIGSTSAPNASAMLQVSGTNKGFLPPQIALTSSTDASTITSPATGLMVYCTGASSLAAGYYYWSGSSWVSLSLGSSSWQLTGNSGTSSLTNFLGTSDNHPLVFKTNNITKLFIDSTTTYVGIGNTKPQSKLDILGTKGSNNTTVNAIDSVNDYIQFNIQNLSLGTGGQSGFTATANNGTNTSNFAWMGINNQNFNNPQQWNIGGGDDVSFMGFGNNLYVSNMSTSSPIIFTTGTSTTPYYNERMRITNAGNVGIGTTAPTSPLHIAISSAVGSGSSALLLQNISGGANTYVDLNTTTYTTATISTPATLRFIDDGNYSDHITFRTKIPGAANDADAERMRIASNGYVGIGTSSPSYPLDVENSVSVTISNYEYMNSTSQSHNGGSLALSFSINASNVIRAGEFDALSDERIKENINSINSNSAADIVANLRPVTYEYIDKPVKGYGTKFGFIAQEVEQYAPTAVKHSSDFIPNVFKMVKDGNNNIACNTENINAGDEVKLITANGEKIVKVLSVNNGSIHMENKGGPNTIEPNSEKSITLDWGKEVPEQNFLVYGTKVDDFRTIDYDQLVSLCVSALQDQQKSIRELNNKLNDQQSSLVDQFKKMTKKERRELRKMLK